MSNSYLFLQRTKSLRFDLRHSHATSAYTVSAYISKDGLGSQAPDASGLEQQWTLFTLTQHARDDFTGGSAPEDLSQGPGQQEPLPPAREKGKNDK